MYEDKTLICKDCGKEFVFTAGEQEFYAEKGFQNEPQRCKASFPAQERQTGLLQRVLRGNESAAGIRANHARTGLPKRRPFSL